MEKINLTVSELFQTGKMPSEILKILKPHVSQSGVYKILKHLRETGSALPKNQKTRTPSLIKNTQKKIRRNPKRR